MDGTRFPLKIGKTILSLESETHALSLKAKNLGVLGSQATIPGYRFFKKKWSYDTLFLKKQLHTMGNTPLLYGQTMCHSLVCFLITIMFEFLHLKNSIFNLFSPKNISRTP